MSRICKRCERIDFGIWGTIGLIGYSLIVAALGYAFAIFEYNKALPIVVMVFGVCLWLPMYFISYHERKEQKE